MPPPFDPVAARRLREQLGMSHANISHGMWASYGLRIHPATVLAWERGEGAPDERELTALAGALWCAPADLLGRPTTLREWRWARGVTSPDLAHQLGMRRGDYERMEERGRWSGNVRQSALLGQLLDIPLPDLLAVTGRAEKLADHLRSTAKVRWQAYAGPVCAMVPLPRERVEEALRRINEEYHALMASTLSWSASAPAEDKSGPYLDGVLDRFWTLLGLN
ncbi:helix-turn-helix transcriptional regulator [Streptomyces sp. PTM05]|uniref:Helix-turn-helix transcriptional regulator n=2 Tax=Streptantibioticus parmotrematis TaxID=2873249 RepID=A0ABS7QZ03_9ACTN|nr:helix-turn-helix transcriptional regulator [Streptantibioticus parmotrematis]